MRSLKRTRDLHKQTELYKGQNCIPKENCFSDGKDVCYVSHVQTTFGNKHGVPFYLLHHVLVLH